MEINDELEDSQPDVFFVPCIKVVKRGIAASKSIADGVKPNLNPQVFQEMFGGPSTSGQIDDDDSDSNEDDEKVSSQPQCEPSQQTGKDEFNFDNYDKEKSEQVLKMSDIVEVTEDDRIGDSENDSDAEDDIIKLSDNLCLVGRVEKDCSSLEVYTFNEEENSLYVHHDFMLPFHILCVEPFSYDPGSQQPGNLCAIGGMEPIIHIYDLDIHQPLEPVMELGKKPSKKKNIKRIGHKDAVLDLAWNPNFQHILASASVDQTVILWDLENATPSTILKDFAEKVQTLEFNPSEGEYLLTGSSDNTIKLFDCRQSDNEGSQYKQWIVEGEVEKVKWNPNEKYNFVAGTNTGKIHYFDSRTTEPLWTIDAHEKEITDFGFNKTAPNMLTSSSVDCLVKIWKYDSTSCHPVHSHHFKLGRIHCLAEIPENNFIIALGGDKKKMNFMVTNLIDLDSVKSTFTNEPVTGSTQEVTMDDDSE
ncbi:CLUMA_CG020664, isoform A [Clunio marinus]|uniref:CLUMA_CG020664, isoform A n=1 Tax=Clunio marinus TaxID=568069 RepID=A0A1J1J5P1_9DIPT|nr:CLUMA_CG020664, isoform A [Clunio marinus]